MVGISVREDTVRQIYVVAGPVKGDFNAAGVVSDDVHVREIRKGGNIYLEYGPLTDSVEAMILSERIRTSLGVNAEVITR